MTSASDDVGFIGLGAMGVEMAQHMHEHLQSGAHAGQARKLHVHNRTKQKADGLLAAGASWQESPTSMAAHCGIVFSMMADDAALRTVFDGFLSGKPASGSVYVDCSTVAPGTTTELAQHAQQAGVSYVSAPVFGRPDAVAAKKVVNVLAGPPEAKARARPLLEIMGRGVMDVGDDPRLGSVMKLVGNFNIAAAIELIAEGMTLAERSGVSRDDVLRFYSYMLPGPLFEGYGGRIAKDQFEVTEATPGFAAKLAQKDVGHIQDLASHSKVPLPIADIVMGHLRQAESRGQGNKDWGIIAAVVREDADQLSKQ